MHVDSRPVGTPRQCCRETPAVSFYLMEERTASDFALAERVPNELCLER